MDRKEIILFVVFIVTYVLVSCLIRPIYNEIKKRKYIGIENTSELYKSLLARFKKNYAYSKMEVQECKKILNVELEELRHTERIIKSDLDAIGVESIFYTVSFACVTAFFKAFSIVTADWLIETHKILFNADLFENLLTVFFLGMTMNILYKAIYQNRKEKFFLCMIEDEIEERKQNDVQEREALKAEVSTLKEEKHVLDMEKISRENVCLRDEIKALKNEIETLKAQNETLEK